MSRPLLLTLTTGLAAGAAAAWSWPSPPATLPVAAPTVLTTTAPRRQQVPDSAVVIAWKELGKDQPGFSQRMAMMTLIARATSGDIPRLLALTQENAFARELLLKRWVEIDAAAAGDWLTPTLQKGNIFDGDSGLAYQDCKTILEAWARVDPKAALAKVKAAAGVLRGMAFQQLIMDAALNSDMALGVKFLAEQTDQVNLFGGLGTDAAWVSKDPAQAAKLLEALPDSEFRSLSLMKAISELGKNDLAGALALLAKFPNLNSQSQRWGGNGDSRAGLFEQWAKEDMQAMIGFVNDHAQGGTRSAMKEAIAKVIGAGDPTVAFDWAADNLSGDRRNKVIDSLLTKLAKDRPTEALDYLVSLPAGTALDHAVNSFTAATKDTEVPSALARAQALPESDARRKLIGSTYLTWFGKEPALALQAIAQQPVASLPKDLWNKLGRGSKNLTDGLVQLSHIPEEQAPNYVSGLFDKQANEYGSDISKTAEGIAQLKVPAQRTEAIQAVVGQWSWRDPAGAVEWGAKLADPAERQLVSKSLEGRLKYLPEAERAALLAPLK